MADRGTASRPTIVARLVADEPTARRISTLLGEMLDADEVVTALLEEPDGWWAVEA